MAYTDLNKPNQIFNHSYRAGTVDANRNGLLWAAIAIVILALFGALYWWKASDITRDVASPQTRTEQIDRPFNSSVLPAQESTPVGQ